MDKAGSNHEHVEVVFGCWVGAALTALEASSWLALPDSSDASQTSLWHLGELLLARDAPAAHSTGDCACGGAWEWGCGCPGQVPQLQLLLDPQVG